MNERWIIRIDYRSPDTRTEIRAVNPQILEDAVRSITKNKSVTLSIEEIAKTTDAGIEETSPSLIINSSNGRYTITAWLEDEFMYDFVGQPLATGKTPLVIGGQVTEYPNRYITNVEQALNIAQEFYQNGTVDLTINQWDEQNANYHMWQ